LTVIFLSSRLHPDGKGVINPIAGRIGTIAASAVLPTHPSTIDFPSNGVAVPNPAVGLMKTKMEGEQGKTHTGIDVLERDGFKLLQGKTVALVTNHTGRNRAGVSTIDLLHKAPGVTLKVLFSPEHGLRGELDEKVADGKDEKTGLPVISLYSGPKRKPTSESL